MSFAEAHSLVSSTLDKRMKIHITALLTICLLLSACGKKKFSMPASSMAPTIPKGSLVIADMNAYKSDSPVRFDIVVFHPPADMSRLNGNEDPGIIYCKRVIGLPGENIEIIENRIFVDSEPLQIPEGLIYLTQGPKTKIKLNPDEYYLLGDNSKNSLDSRYWGSLSKSNILGKVTEIQPVR
jgi:signal peptidase I